MNLSFAGCGFLGIYHVGVSVCFKKYAPHLLLDKISGASAGAISACCLLCDLPLGDITSDLLRVVHEARSGSLGPFSPTFSVQAVLMEGLVRFLPHDAHLRVNGKLHISLTRVYDGKNVIVSHFNSREDLMQALMATCFIPVFSGLLPPKFHGVRYMDGGFSDNLPVLDENTITVSPFCGESDICPRDLSSQLFHVNVANTSIELSKQNISRFARILFPPKPEVLSNMCKQGFDDALRFLQRNNLISCTSCLAVQSTIHIQDSMHDSMDYDPECLECKHHRQEALSSNLPDTVLSVFQNAIDSANKGLLNWMFRHRIMSLLTLPCTLPRDIMLATFAKLVKYRPSLRVSLLYVCRLLLRQAQGALRPSRAPAVSRRPTPLPPTPVHEAPAEDNYGNMLRATDHQAALMAYYYVDSDNLVKVTEIFDVTSAEQDGESVNQDTHAQSHPHTHAHPHIHAHDMPWTQHNYNLYDNELEGMSEISLEDMMYSKSMFFDPESEWNRSRASPSGESSSADTTQGAQAIDNSDQPESDQPPPQ